jgi:membrane-associated phospholipid phosphatase
MKMRTSKFFLLVLFLICWNQSTLTQLNGQNKFSLSKEKETIILSTGALTVISSLLLEKNESISLNEINSLDKKKINFFDRSATNFYSKNLSQMSDVLLIASVCLPAGFLIFENNKSELANIGLMYLETLTLTYGITNLTKNITQRFRPYAYNPSVPFVEKSDPDTKKSFFSGHTSTAFASAIFFASIFSEINKSESSKKIVWIGSFSLASAVGLLRYYSGKHFPTDIIAGALIGGAIGYGIPKLHQSDENFILNTNGQSFISLRVYF